MSCHSTNRGSFEMLCRFICFPKVVQDISNSAWASARLLIRDSRLWTALSAAAQEAMPHFAPQKISNTAWALSTVEVRVPGKAWQKWQKCKQIRMEYVDHYGLEKTFFDMFPLRFCTSLQYITIHVLATVRVSLKKTWVTERIGQSVWVALISGIAKGGSTKQSYRTRERTHSQFVLHWKIFQIPFLRRKRQNKMLILCKEFNSAYFWGVSLLLFWNRNGPHCRRFITGSLFSLSWHLFSERSSRGKFYKKWEHQGVWVKMEDRKADELPLDKGPTLGAYDFHLGNSI